MKGNGYQFLPFRFKRLGGNVLLVNDVGDFYYTSEDTFNRFIRGELSVIKRSFHDLQSKFMVSNGNIANTVDLIATRYRTKKKFLFDFTALHMFVVTHRCNQKCAYCHASSENEFNDGSFDMDDLTAQKAVDFAFKTPSQYIKFEFQGGEPTLNFKAIRTIIEYARQLNLKYEKHIDFVICTNLLAITDDQLKYIKKNNILVSTSLDGPKEIHDSCRRTRQGGGTYESIIRNMKYALEFLGPDRVSALMTVTKHNLFRLNEVVDEYIEQGFNSVFLRMMNPYGYAATAWNEIGYDVDEFLDGFGKTLKYILQLNRDGKSFTEEFTALLLTRILTPFSTGFVDLQSPTGAGIGGVIYETNGDIFVADEGRMLSKMNGDKTFCIGNVQANSWQAVFCGNQLRKIVSSSCIESLPGCAWCAYQPYCGSDPVRNYIQFGTFHGNSAKSDFCKKHKAIFDLLFQYINQNDQDIMDIFWSWITRRSKREVSV